jgi:aryl-alcohol dehydrogenase-like predicted oxidoreductase
MLQQVQQFAKQKNHLTSQIALAWLKNKGSIPIPGSSSFENNKHNVDAYFIDLTFNDMKQINTMIHDMTKKWGIKRYL